MNPLNTELSKEEFRQLRNELHTFYTEHTLLFKSLFQKNELIEYGGHNLNRLLTLDIVSKTDGLWSSNYSIYEFNRLYFITDSFLLPKTDRVFPLSQDESLFLAGKVTVKKGDQVLDIGTGSGVYSIIAAQQGALVTAVDINPKALNYAKFNALLNDVADRIEFISGNVFENLEHQSFDYIFSNPAIIPTAENSGFYIHSDGGIDGTNMSFDIIENFADYLNSSGKLQMLATSFTTAGGKMVIEDFIRHYYSKKNIRFTIQELYTPCLDELSSLTNHFAGTENHMSLVGYINDNGFNSLRYLYITAQAGTPFEISRIEKEENFETTGYNGSWQGRLARLFMVYPKIAVRKIREKIID